MSRLHNGQQFPALSVPAVGGGSISLPDDLAGSYGIVLIYRGSWCPYCNAQLASFSRAMERLDQIGAKVVALSVDDEAHLRCVRREASNRLSGRARRRCREGRRRGRCLPQRPAALPAVDRLRARPRTARC